MTNELVPVVGDGARSQNVNASGKGKSRSMDSQPEATPAWPHRCSGVWSAGPEARCEAPGGTQRRLSPGQNMTRERNSVRCLRHCSFTRDELILVVSAHCRSCFVLLLLHKSDFESRILNNFSFDLHPTHVSSVRNQNCKMFLHRNLEEPMEI